MKLQKLNKKGYSLAGWTEGILFTLLFVMLFGGLLGGFNSLYGDQQNLKINSSSSLNAFIDQGESVQATLTGEETEFTSDEGIINKGSWKLVLDLFTTIWDFINGNWISYIVIDFMSLPYQVAWVLKTIYFLSLAFVALNIFFKVKP